MSDENNRKIAAQCWMAGNKSVATEQWDYAIEMYGKAVKLDPGNLTYRQSLRGAEYKLYKNNKTGASMSGMRLMGTKGQLQKSKMTKNWAQVSEVCEDGLKLNPWDVQLNIDLGDACRHLGFSEVAIFTYEEIIKLDPAHKTVNQTLAELLEERGEYQRAAACWERLLKADPLNGKARQKIVDLQTLKTIVKSDFEGAKSGQDVAASNKVKRGNADQNELGMSTETELIRAIKKEPNNKDNYLKLAAYYKRVKDLEKCEEQYKIVLDMSGGDVNIRELLEDVQLDRLREAREASKQDVAANPDKPEFKKRVAEISRELMNREIEVMSARSERYPQDMKIKFELGQRLMSLGQWQKAIPLFQSAKGDSRIKGASLLALGKCFKGDGKLPLARRQYELALPEVTYDAQPDVYKELHYTLARLCEDLGDLKAAENHYQSVIEVDYNFKDANERLEKMQGNSPVSSDTDE